jgi:hypothetical protein
VGHVPVPSGAGRAAGEPWYWLLQALVFASAAAGLVATGHRTLALVFGVIVVVNAVLVVRVGAVKHRDALSYSIVCETILVSGVLVGDPVGDAAYVLGAPG